MDFPIYIETIIMGLSIEYFKGSQVDCSKLRCIWSLKDALILANSADPDEMLHYAAFHLGHHCLGKYTFRGLQNTKGLSLLSLFYNFQREHILLKLVTKSYVKTYKAILSHPL